MSSTGFAGNEGTGFAGDGSVQLVVVSNMKNGSRQTITVAPGTTLVNLFEDFSRDDATGQAGNPADYNITVNNQQQRADYVLQANDTVRFTYTKFAAGRIG